MADCTPTSLMAQANCFKSCLQPDQIQAVIAYLLAQLAGGSTDPLVLFQQASCFHSCLNPHQLKAVQVYLLCQIAP